MTQASIIPTRLLCEYQSHPLCVDVASPRLSWILEAQGRGQTQSAYQILVAGSKADLAAEKHLLWDSGKIASHHSVNRMYEGEAPRAGARYYWKVRVWDQEDRPSAWSEPAMWGMGLLHPSDWQGKWTCLGEAANAGTEPPSGEEWDEMLLRLTPHPPYLRKAFTLSRPVREATLYATARGVYELWLNGARVGDEVLAPGWTDYHTRIQYQACDVTEQLQTGANALGGILGDGWYAGYYGFDPKRRGAHYGSRPYLLVQLDIHYDDGTTEHIVSDESWKSANGPLLYSDLLMGEMYDARAEFADWSVAGFDDSQWRGVSVEEIDASKLVGAAGPPVRVTQEIKAQRVTNPRPGVYVFDLGQNMVGWVRLTVEGAAGTQVTLRHAEMLNPDGTIYTKNLKAARATDIYILKGGTQEVFEPHFTFHGFRYVEVTGYPGAPELSALTGRVVHSDTPLTGTFSCSSALVNQLQSNILWGQRGNFLSVPTDCPQRDERLGWMGDAQIFIRTACYNADVAAFFTKWMVDVEDAQSPLGAFPDVAPRLHLSFTSFAEGAPAWGDAGIIVPWTIYQVYGDTRIIERHYDAMSRWMEYIHVANPDLLRKNRLNRNFGDWLSPGGDQPPRDLLATAYWAYDASLMADMARATGRQDDARQYEQLFEGIKAAFNAAYVTSDGRVKGETQTGYALALYMNLLPDELRAAAARHLVEAIEEKDWHLSTGFVGVGYLCPALTEAGHADVAYRLLNSESYPSWGYTIRQGATTIWERWDGWTEEKGFQSPNMNSFNHYSLGSIGEWLYRYVAGIDLDPQHPGYEHFVIHPRLGGGLSWARGEYDSIQGKIVSHWQSEENRIVLRVTIPANTTATVYLPALSETTILESGRPLSQAEGIELLSQGNGEVVIAASSGTYEFDVRV